MLNLVIALGVGVAVAVLIKLLGFPLLAGIVPGVVLFLGAYVYLARRIALKVQALSQEAQKELSVPVTNPREQKQRVGKAIEILERGLVYDRWQFLIASEIHAQVGMIKYMVKDYDGAEAHFLKSSPRNYMAKAMHAALHFQKKNYPAMKSSFEAAVKAGKKEGLIWSAYAWCLQSLKEKDAALSVMARAVEANPSDEKLKSGLSALQNDKKLKMKPYEPMWWQFGLEAPPMQMPAGGRRVQFSRR